MQFTAHRTSNLLAQRRKIRFSEDGGTQRQRPIPCHRGQDYEPGVHKGAGQPLVGGIVIPAAPACALWRRGARRVRSGALGVVLSMLFAASLQPRRITPLPGGAPAPAWRRRSRLIFMRRVLILSRCEAAFRGVGSAACGPQPEARQWLRGWIVLRRPQRVEEPGGRKVGSEWRREHQHLFVAARFGVERGGRLIRQNSHRWVFWSTLAVRRSARCRRCTSPGGHCPTA